MFDITLVYLLSLLKILQEDGQKEVEQDEVHENEDQGVENDRNNALSSVRHGHQVIPVITNRHSEDGSDAHG